VRPRESCLPVARGFCRQSPCIQARNEIALTRRRPFMRVAGSGKSLIVARVTAR
jgi:hypothetical protein